jgi:hypothetical protein
VVHPSSVSGTGGWDRTANHQLTSALVGGFREKKVGGVRSGKRRD